MADKDGIRRHVVWKLKQNIIAVSYKGGIGTEASRSEYQIKDNSRIKSVYYGAMEGGL